MEMYFLKNDVIYEFGHIFRRDGDVIYLVCKEKRINFSVYDTSCDTIFRPVQLLYYHGLVTKTNIFIDDQIFMRYNFINEYPSAECETVYGNSINIYEHHPRYINNAYEIEKIATYYLIKDTDCIVTINDDIEYKKHEFSDAILIIFERNTFNTNFRLKCGSIISDNDIEVFVYQQFCCKNEI